MIPKVIAVCLTLLFLLPAASIGASGHGATRHSLDIRVDMAGRTVSGTDTIAVDKGASVVTLILRDSSEVTRVHASSADIPFETSGGKGLKEITVRFAPGEAPREITVHFNGSFQSTGEAQSQVKRGVAYLDDGVIGDEGAFLPSSALWYPQPADGFAVFEATVTMPPGYSSVMEGELARRTDDGQSVTERWVEWKPIDGMDLVVGRYDVKKEIYNGVAIYTYFLKEDAALSRTYIDKTKGYLDTYSGLIGKYPYAKFAVVENFMPTGYGMPSFTVLGTGVIRLPFIPDTSLGHEIAHNWWGNSVFIDPTLGNWSEALTTYTADYLYARLKGEDEARDFRVSKLRGYKAYAGKGRTTLRGFNDSTGAETRAVGYNKGLMVFNMLERHIGEPAFKAGLKRFYSENAFKRASWADIQHAFESASGKDLKWFFEQWLARADGPRLVIAEARAQEADGSHSVTLRVEQQAEPYVLDLPVLFETAAGPVWRTFRIKSSSEVLTTELAAAPLSAEIDPDSQNFRILSDDEVPATMAGFFGDKDSAIILPNRSVFQEKYMLAADLLSKDFGSAILSDAEVGKKDYLKDTSLLLLGGPKENRFYWLTGQYFSKHARITDEAFEVGGKTFPKNGAALMIAARNPHDPSKTLCLFTADMDRISVLEAAKRMRYFTDASWLVITPDGKAHKGTFDAQKTLKATFK